MSMVGLMGRLAAAERRTVRLTDLAGAMGLSLSRVSRIVDILEGRGLVERQASLTDARATNAHLTRKGLLLDPQGTGNRGRSGPAQVPRPARER